VSGFFLHLFTITIGLFIALSLESLVEWQHHGHLVHDAEAGLHDEIAANAKGLQETASDIQRQQANLHHDVDILNRMRVHKNRPGNIEITFHIRTFDDVSWKTAQTTGALAYMSYPVAQTYASIYGTQELIDKTQSQAARDAILSLAPFMNLKDDTPEPSPAQCDAMIAQIQILEGQLQLLAAEVNSLDRDYKKFLADHPG
jgi:hypothetical protein